MRKPYALAAVTWVCLFLALLLAACGDATPTGTTSATVSAVATSAATVVTTAASANTATTAATTVTTAAATASVAAPAKGSGTITVAASQNWVKDVDRKLADDFTKATGIKVDFQVNPDDQYANIIKTKIATKEAPDVMLLGAGVLLENYQPEKNFLDLSNEPWAANMKDWAKNGATVGGKLYGLNTWSVDGWGLLYNTDIFAKYNLAAPKTYDEFTKVCDTLLANGITPVYENAKDEWHLPIWLNELALDLNKQNPGVLTKLNANAAKFSEQKPFITGLTQLQEMNKKGYFGKNVLSNDWANGYVAMGTGKAAMILAYTTYQAEILQKYPTSGADKWKMFPVPLNNNTGFAQSAGGIVRVVNKNSANLEAVRSYFNSLTQNENLKTYYTGRPDLGETSFKGLEVAPPSAALKSVTEIAGSNVGSDLDASLKFWNGQLAGKQIQDLLSGASSPQQVLQKLDDDRDKSFKVAQ